MRGCDGPQRPAERPPRGARAGGMGAAFATAAGDGPQPAAPHRRVWFASSQAMIAARFAASGA